MGLRIEAAMGRRLAGIGLAFLLGALVLETGVRVAGTRVRGLRISPQPWEVSGEREDLRPLLVAHVHPVRLALAFIVLLSLGQCTQLVVPVRLQRVSHQSVLGIDRHVAPACQFRLIPSPLHLPMAQAVRFVDARLESTRTR